MRGVLHPLAEVIGESPGMVAVRETIGRLLRHLSSVRRLPPVLIQGETGTGKGLLARALHRASRRADGPFVDVNCAAIPEPLLEAEMFGFERGAFTDARQSKPGLFQTAHHGTLFLDEVGHLPEGLQVKLLKALEEQAVRRLGSTRSEAVDVWILSATSADLATVLRHGRFHEALYHRLALVMLELPPLRERGDDILLLADHFLDRACADYHLPSKTLDATARAALLAYGWPGNVRELGNVMERVALLAEVASITAASLGLPGPMPQPPPAPVRTEALPLAEAVGSVEQEHLLAALRQTHWNISQAAARLGISRNTLRYRIEKYGLRPGAPPPPRQRRSQAPPEPPSATRTAAPVALPSPSASLRWERRYVTLLRAELVAAPETISPTAERWVLEALVERVQSFGGRLAELSPAGLVAVFGLEPAEDAPTRAVLAAMAMQKAAAPAHSNQGDRIAVTVGIHVSQVLVGRVGGTAQLEWDAKRQLWAVLEELLARAGPETILVTETAARFLQRRFALVPGDPMERVPGQWYRVAGHQQTWFGLGGRVTPLVGRQEELGLLQHRLTAAMRGQGQVVGMVGEPGIGKSRLLFEFATRLSGQPVTYLEGRCLSYGSTTPYLPILGLIRQQCGLTDADAPAELAEKVRRSLQALGMPPDEGAPHLLHLLGVTVGAEPLAVLSPEAVKARTFALLRQMSLHASRQQPLVVAIEDLHWSDQTSEAYLTALVEHLPGAPILLLCTYRPGYRPPWLEKSYATQVALQPLTPQDSLGVVQAVCQTVPLPSPLAEAILRQAEGNPLFLEELTQAVVERGDVHSTVAVPATLEGVLLARIDRLAEGPKQLLQTAAVLGRDVSPRLLWALWDGPGELEAPLQELQRLELLYAHTGPEEPSYRFKHALTQEVAYGSLLHARRRELHARIVDAIEALHRDQLGGEIERLAYHALRGELGERAVHYLRQAGLKAATRSALSEARTWLDQALDVLGKLPESRSTLEQAVDIRLDLRTVLYQLHAIPRMLDRLREAEVLAENLNDDHRRGRVCAFLTNMHTQLSQLDDAHACGIRALGIAQRLGDLKLRIVTTTYLEQVHHYRGEFEQAVELVTGNLAALPADWVYEYLENQAPASVYDRYWLIESLAQLGRFTEAVEYESEVIRLAEPTHHPYTIALAYLAGSMLRLLKGDWAKARSLAEHSLAVQRTGNVRILLHTAIASSAWALAQLGEAGEVLDRVRECEKVLEREACEGVRGYNGGRACHLLGCACLLLGRLDDARRLCDRAIKVSQPAYAPYALHLAADIATHPDRFDAERGEAQYREALALAEPRGMRPLIAHCHLGLGKLYRRTGRRERALEHLTTATTMYREMDMRFFLEQAAAGLVEVR